jgi:hypothetical protein
MYDFLKALESTGTASHFNVTASHGDVIESHINVTASHSTRGAFHSTRGASHSTPLHSIYAYWAWGGNWRGLRAHD